MLLGKWVYRYLFEILFFSSFGYIPRSGIAGSYGNSIFTFLRSCRTVYPLQRYHFTFPPVGHKGSNLSTPYICNFCLFIYFLIVAIVLSVRWYLIVVVICISLTLRWAVLGIFSCAYWSLVCLLWRNIHSGHLPVFDLNCFLLLLSLGVLSIFPGSSVSEESACSLEDLGSIPGSGRSPGEGNGNPLQCSWPGISHGQRSLVGCSPRSLKESDTT